MSEEPIGVMKCWECVEKHSRDLEHHYEDIVRVEKDKKKRLEYEEVIDFIRKVRKEAHEKAKGIAIEEIPMPKTVAGEIPKHWELGKPEAEEEIQFSEPIRRERGEHVYVDVFHEKSECYPKTFRTIKPNPQHILTVCCPQAPVAGRCPVGMMAQKLEHLHPEGEKGSCPVCEALA